MTSCKSEKIGPGKVFIDDNKVIFKSGFVVREKKAKTYGMRLFNHVKTNCDEIMKYIRNIEEGEISFRIYASPKGFHGVGVGAFTYFGAKVNVIKKPIKVGDIVEIAITDEVTFQPNVGIFKGKDVKAVGLFKGIYCGER